METKKVTPEMKALLQKPLPAAAISKHPTKTYLSSIKAIYVTERLNEVFGIGGWKFESKFVEKIEGMIVVYSTLSIPEYGIELSSFGGNDNGGSSNKNFDLGDAYKGATTDALTKICSWLEIGIDVFKGFGSAPAPRQEQSKKQSEVIDKAVANYIEPIPHSEAMPITLSQKTQILLLIGNSVFSKEEREKTTDKVNTYDTVKAEKVIAALKKQIAERSTTSNAAA